MDYVPVWSSLISSIFGPRVPPPSRVKFWVDTDPGSLPSSIDAPEPRPHLSGVKGVCFCKDIIHSSKEVKEMRGDGKQSRHSIIFLG